jgi:hypothetical protein
LAFQAVLDDFWTALAQWSEKIVALRVAWNEQVRTVLKHDPATAEVLSFKEEVQDLLFDKDQFVQIHYSSLPSAQVDNKHVKQSNQSIVSSQRTHVNITDNIHHVEYDIIAFQNTYGIERSVLETNSADHPQPCTMDVLCSATRK